MSGGIVANAGGIYVSGAKVDTPDQIDRQIHLMIYQLAAYINHKEHGTHIQDAALNVLGSPPQPGEIQASPIMFKGCNAMEVNVYDGAGVLQINAITTGISTDVTLFPQNDHKLYYVLDLQDLPLVVTILQLNDQVENAVASKPVHEAALAAFEDISTRFTKRVHHQRW